MCVMCCESGRVGPDNVAQIGGIYSGTAKVPNM
jgi:hypothetical protein